MRYMMLITGICIVFFGCNTEPKPEISKTDNKVAKEPIIYPFTP